MRGPVLELDAIAQLLQHLGADRAVHAHRVLAFHLVGGMHQAIGKRAVVGEQQQATGIDIETSDADPASLVQTRQLLVHRVAPLRVGSRADFADRLVIHKDLRAGHVALQAQQLAVDGDFFTTVDLVAGFGDLAVDADAPLLQHRVDLPARARTLVSEIFLYAFHRAIIPFCH